MFFFFFSSRRRHTRSLRDWSSDVCSSDLETSSGGPSKFPANQVAKRHRPTSWRSRSEERREGKECRSRRSPYHYKKNKKLNERTLPERKYLRQLYSKMFDLSLL